MPNDTPNHEFPSEAHLRHAARHIKSLLPNSDEPERLDKDISDLKATFNEFFAISSTPALVASHRVAAWNALCALIDQTASSPLDSVSQLIWSESIWDRAFDLYLSQSRNARPKSLKQLLVSLGSSLRTAPLSDERRSNVVDRLIQGIWNRQDFQLAKASVLVLSHFLSKDIVTLDDVANRFHALSGRPLSKREGIQRLLFGILALVGRGDLGSTISQAIGTVLGKAERYGTDLSQSPLNHEAIWIHPLRMVLKDDYANIEQVRVHIFPVLFRRSLADYVSFLDSYGLSKLVTPSRAYGNDLDGTHDSEYNDTQDAVLFSGLQAGKELGLVVETEDSEASQSDAVLLLPVSQIGGLLRQSSRSSRLAGLALLIFSHSLTRPFSKNALQLLRHNLPNFFADTDASFRGEVFSLMQKLMDRMRAITAMLARKSNVDSGDQTELNRHRDFISWLLQLLQWELRPTASYQRHISALKTLSLVARSGIDRNVREEVLTKSAVGESKWPFHFELVSEGRWHLLLDLLLDPFDDVRQSASTILSLFTPPDDSDALKTRDRLERVSARAQVSMLATGRADQADGVAHMASLSYHYSPEDDTFSHSGAFSRSRRFLNAIEKLEQLLLVAQSSLVTAARGSPLHGQLTSLRYMILQDTRRPLSEELQDRLSTCVTLVWDVVKPVLCDDAPEGFQLDEADISPDISTKDTLSYCWRALKESSLLLSVLIGLKDINPQLLESLSNLCFTQLAELRHRGAFSTVAQTWVTCCAQCASLESADGTGMLSRWYTRILHILRSKATINTRRSAGIPSLLCGLLIADTTGTLIKMAFPDLNIIARQIVDSDAMQESSLPQVHAMNCIKDVLKNTRLGEQAERYVPDAVRLAADSLRSESWAIRNCGLMLFRAVIDRLLGTSDANLDDDFGSSSRISAQDYPELLEIAIDLLSPQDPKTGLAGSTRNEGVFPALQLLQRMEVPESRVLEAKAAVLVLTASSSWHVRDKSARAFASLVKTEDIIPEFQWILSIGTLSMQNALHGLLLSAKHLISKASSSQILSSEESLTRFKSESQRNADLAIAFLHLLLSAKHLYSDNNCTATMATYIDIFRQCLSQVIMSSRSDDLDDANGLQNASLLTLLRGFDVLAEIQQWTTGDQAKEQGSAMLRAALAQVLPYVFATQMRYCTAREAEDLRIRTQDAIISLEDCDPDAASAFYHSFKEIFDLGLVCPQAPDLLIKHATQLLVEDCDMEVACHFLEALLASMSSSTQPSLSLDELSNLLRCADPTATNANQLYADLHLEFQAILLDAYISRTDHDLSNAKEAFREFTASCELATSDENLYSREAVARSLSRFQNVWKYLIEHSTQKELRSTLFALTQTLYDLLNDDDEDLRILASQSVCRLLGFVPSTIDQLSGSSKPLRRNFKGGLDPLSAADELLRFMLMTWRYDVRSAVLALQRAFGLSMTTDSNSNESALRRENFSERIGSIDRLESAAERLRVATQQDTALFATEKQNLYIDEAREVKIWSRMLIRLFSGKQSDMAKWTGIIKQLENWVTEGLEVFTAGLQDRELPEEEGQDSDKRELTGVLLARCSSKTEVFLRGLQLSYAVEVLLCWIDQGGRTSIVSPSRLRAQSYRFGLLVAKAEEEVNVLWRGEVERVTAIAVTQGMQVQGSKLHQVEMK